MENVINLKEYCNAAFEGRFRLSRESLTHAAKILNQLPEPTQKELEMYAAWMGVDPNKAEEF